MLTVPRVDTANAYMYRKLELDDAVLKRSNEALAKALQGGNSLRVRNWHRLSRMQALLQV